MNNRINAIYQKIKKLEEELEEEISEARDKIQYTIHEKRVLFEKSIVAYHKKLRKTLYRYLREASLLHALTFPFIYLLIIPIIFMDIAISFYQFICFPVYGVKKVPRSDFIVMDRHHLEYLNLIEKLNCAYCGYATGVAAYFREVVSRTEEYWCPIKHAGKVKAPHQRYNIFVAYGNADEYRERMKEQNQK